MEETNNIKVGDTVPMAIVDSLEKTFKLIKRNGFIVQILTISNRSTLIRCCYLKGKEWQLTNTYVPTVYSAPVSRMVLTEKVNKIFEYKWNT